MQVVVIHQEYRLANNVIDYESTLTGRLVDSDQGVLTLWRFPKISKFFQIHRSNTPFLSQRPPYRMAEPLGKTT